MWHKENSSFLPLRRVPQGHQQLDRSGILPKPIQELLTNHGEEENKSCDYQQWKKGENLNDLIWNQTVEEHDNGSSKNSTELPPIHSPNLNPPATSLKVNENGFVTLKSKREKLIRGNIKRASCTSSVNGIIKGGDDKKVPMKRKTLTDGTTYSMLPEELYNSVVGEFGKSGYKRAREVEDKTELSPCYYTDQPVGDTHIKKVKKVSVPQLVLHFGIPKKNYFYEFTDGKKIKRKVGCMTLMNAGYFPESGGPAGLLLGNYLQQGLEVVYGLLNKRVGFARRKCSSLWDTSG
nr:probable aspartyl protease At4g16563 [Tanacetum cinerariifolium]